MNDFGGVLALQVETLLKALRERQQLRCAELLNEAEGKATGLVRRTRRKLRERLHQAVDEERKRREAALQLAAGRIQTAERRAVLKRYEGLLHAAWPLLQSEMLTRWSNPECRRQWCEMLLIEAHRVFGSGSWIVEHPVDWSAKDTRWFTERLQSIAAPEPTLREVDIQAGLIIYSDSTRLNGSIQGLLARRAELEAQVLAAWERTVRKSQDAERTTARSADV